MIENQILSGSIGADEKMYSQYQLADMYNINPATAAKGLTILLDEEILEKMDLKPFSLEKMKSFERFNLNIILIFALERLSKNQKMDLLNECKRLVSKEGQLIVIGEYFSNSVLLFPFSLIKEFVNLIKNKIFKKKTAKPLRNFEKLANKTELKFFDVKYDANGRIRTYVLTKRWGALLR